MDNDQKVILIPINDFSASVIDQNIDTLKDHYLFPNIHMRQGAITEWMNKEKQKIVAKSVGLNVANSCSVEIKDGEYHLPDSITYPCFTKTREYRSRYKHTLHRCADEKELRKVMDDLKEMFHNITIMVEDYKEIETEYAVVGLASEKEVVIPGVIEITKMAQGTDKGVACQGKIMPVKGFEALVEKFKKVILEIGFIGIFDIDFYKSNGEYFFGEINLRIGGSGYAVQRMGVNLPLMFVRSMLGESIDGMKKEIDGTATYINERICLENWYADYFTTREFKKMLESSDFGFVNDKIDPVPERAFKGYFFYKRIRRSLKKILHR
jgi:carbamoylphosphate synthase large subunit